MDRFKRNNGKTEFCGEPCPEGHRIQEKKKGNIINQLYMLCYVRSVIHNAYSLQLLIFLSLKNFINISTKEYYYLVYHI